MMGCGMAWCGMQSSLVRAIMHYLLVLSAPATPMFSAALANKCVNSFFEGAWSPCLDFRILTSETPTWFHGSRT